MGHVANIIRKNSYIELHRTFYEYSKSGEGDDSIILGPEFRVGKKLGWSELVKEYRLIILSKAGSGKTTEIRNIAEKLSCEGKPAFFLRLENIVHDFESSFEIGSLDSFKKWLSSNQEGWLLLDSVDEARLQNPKDFERAIIRINKCIVSAKDRAHIVITSRDYAWRPKTDLDLCSKLFPYPLRTNVEKNTDRESLNEDEGNRNISLSASAKKKDGREESAF